MKLFRKISEYIYNKREEKNPKRRSRRKEYLLSKKTPFNVTEAFRNLKASLSVSVAKREKGMTLLLTSACPEDGKTTVAVNLALMFALSDAKVLLVDADIRKGCVSKYFKTRAVPGLSDYLSGQSSLQEIIRTEEGVENFSYITCGTHSPKPYELLESEEMKELLEQLKRKYDYIIIDTPPVLLISDALALTSSVDGVSVVCRHQSSYVSDVSRALSALKFAKANILGVIVNDYKEIRQAKYGYKNYYYYSSYEYKETKTNDLTEAQASL